MTYPDDSGNAKDLLLDKKISFRMTKMRWVALAFGCTVMMGSYFSYDNPQALQAPLEDPAGKYDLSGLQFNLLYSVYSFPNIILPLFGGVLVDKIGARVAILIFSSILILGQAIFTFGLYKYSYTIMIIGRVVFGLGGESLSVAQSAIVSKWFRGKELAFALGFNISVARLGSSINSVATPMMAKDGDLWIPALVGVCFCALSTCCGIGLSYMDKESDRREGITKATEISPDEQIQFSDIKNFRALFWLLLTSCLLIYGSFFGFTNNGNSILVTIFGMGTDRAGQLLTIVYISSACLTPVIGAFSDKFGRRTGTMLISNSLLIIAHFTMAFFPESNEPNYFALVPLFLIGIFYSSYAAVFWPCVPLVVEAKAVGTAFGIITAFQNGMLSLNPVIMGAIQDATSEHKGGFMYSEIYLGALAVIGLINAFAIFINDKKSGNVLWEPSKRDDVKASKRSVYASLRN
eukprot:CAMPEP_0176444524 /NCGR_PEP_ID=MMETSP0127-20121128/23114_1 /TAXON_ID=938130 /ORGANISM="Platyophrya macrostoma, Strain WH" /LENGTH=462 /DNA_ID=CAMNT_0017830049 /DNA_START=22 /DNA_END=1410 /DNA_ORIENTATION=+